MRIIKAELSLLGVAVGITGAVAAVIVVGCRSEPKQLGPTSTIVATVGPLPTANLSVPGVIEDRAKGYRTHYPEGWRARPNLLHNGDEVTDGFFDPETSDQPVNTNLSVTVGPARPNESLEAFVADRRRIIEGIANGGVLAATIKVGSIDAVMLSYSSLSGKAPRQSREVFFVADGKRWNIALVTPPDELERYSPSLIQMLTTFELL